MAAKRRNRPPVASRGATGKHATKTQEERQEYKDHVRFAPGAGETVEHTPPGGEGISAPPDIRGSPVPVGGGDKRRIELPAPPVAVESPLLKLVVGVLSFFGFAAIVAVVTVFYQSGRVVERVDNIAQIVEEVGDKQDEARDDVGRIAERLAKLETQVDFAVKSGASAAALAAEAALLRQALEAHRAGHGDLAKRIDAVEARLASVGTGPSTP